MRREAQRDLMSSQISGRRVCALRLPERQLAGKQRIRHFTWEHMASIPPTPIIVFTRNSLSRTMTMKTRMRCRSSCLPSIIISLKSIPLSVELLTTTMSGMPIIPAIGELWHLWKGSRWLSSPVISRLAGRLSLKTRIGLDWLQYHLCMEPNSFSQQSPRINTNVQYQLNKGILLWSFNFCELNHGMDVIQPGYDSDQFPHDDGKREP